MKLSLTNRALADLENINAYLTPAENVGWDSRALAAYPNIPEHALKGWVTGVEIPSKRQEPCAP